MFPMSIVQIHSKLTMKNRNNMVSKIKLSTFVILTISMFSCGNKAENPIEQSNINPDIKINMVVVSDEYFKFKGGKYYIQKSLNKLTGNKTFFDKVKEINAIDSTDNLPNIELGEYRFIEIEFVADNYVNLKLASFSVHKDPDYNVKKNWINKCEIVDGSKSIFDKGGNIKSLFNNSEFLSINCPATKETTNLVNEQSINYLPDGAVVTNAARGDIIDDTAMIKAMKSGKVFALGLDVYNGEPKINPEYLKLNNLFLLPHIGSATFRTRIDMGDRAIDNLENFFNNKKPKDQVN